MEEFGKHKIVPKDLSEIDVSKLQNFIKVTKTALKLNGGNFKEERRISGIAINYMYKMLAKEVEYTPIVDKNGNEVYDELDLGYLTKDAFDKEGIDREIEKRGFGFKSADKDKIVHGEKTHISQSDVDAIIDKTESNEMTSWDLMFSQKVSLVSKFIQKFQQQEIVNYQENVKKLDEIVKQGNYESIVNEMANKQLSNYYESMKAKGIDNVDEYYRQSKYGPEVAIVCGMPALGKSSVFINNLKKQGYFSIDLDDIAVDIAKKFDVTIDSSTSGNIYKIANDVYNNLLQTAMSKNYNISVEKIGWTKGQIEGFANDIDKIANSIPSSIDKQYGKKLLMAYGVAKDSMFNNAIRTSSQVFNGETIRGYSYKDLILSNNSPTYAYLEVLKDSDLCARFSQIKLADRTQVYDGLSINREQTSNYTIGQEISTAGAQMAKS